MGTRKSPKKAPPPKRVIHLQAETVGVEHDNRALLTHLVADAGRAAAGLERLAVAFERIATNQERQTLLMDPLATRMANAFPAPPPAPPVQDEALEDDGIS